MTSLIKSATKSGLFQVGELVKSKFSFSNCYTDWGQMSMDSLDCDIAAGALGLVVDGPRAAVSSLLEYKVLFGDRTIIYSEYNLLKVEQKNKMGNKE